jgi:hypothetical protein
MYDYNSYNVLSSSTSLLGSGSTYYYNQFQTRSRRKKYILFIILILIVVFTILSLNANTSNILHQIVENMNDLLGSSLSLYLLPLGCKDILDNRDDNDTCTPFEIFSIQLKAECLAITLSVALELYASNRNFLDICDIAIKKVNELDGGDDFVDVSNDKNTKGYWHPNSNAMAL